MRGSRFIEIRSPTRVQSDFHDGIAVGRKLGIMRDESKWPHG
jgi:hypothetical protein